MFERSVLAVLMALACAAPVGAAQAQSRFAPSDPVEFERVSLRQTVDSCAFDETRVRVSFDGRVIKVIEPRNACFAPGPPEVVDIQLGAFPAGEYAVEIHLADDQPALERLTLHVDGIVTPAIFPPLPRPIADYSGLWWNPAESGWGLSLHQGATSGLFGALFVFNASGAPEWLTLQSGRWESSTRWSGTAYRSSGSAWGPAGFDPHAVSNATVGTVVIDFTMTPGREDRATFTLVLGGLQVERTITRTRL